MCSLHVWRIEPDYISFFASISLGASGLSVGIADFVGGVTALAHGVQVVGSSFCTLVLIAQKLRKAIGQHVRELFYDGWGVLGLFINKKGLIVGFCDRPNFTKY